MSITWFRLYHDLPNDIKLRRFTPQEKWAWVALLCLASQSKDRGVVEAENEDIADYCEFNCTQDWLYFRDKLIAKGMLEINADGKLHILNWENRQYEKPSDRPEAVNARVKKHRAKKKEKAVTPCNALQTPCNATDTDPDTDPDSETDPDTHKIRNVCAEENSEPEPETEPSEPESSESSVNGSTQIGTPEESDRQVRDKDIPPPPAPKILNDSESCDRSFQQFPFGYINSLDPGFEEFLRVWLPSKIPSYEGKTLTKHDVKRYALKAKHDNQRLENLLLFYEGDYQDFLQMRANNQAAIAAASTAPEPEPVAVPVSTPPTAIKELLKKLKTRGAENASA